MPASFPPGHSQTFMALRSLPAALRKMIRKLPHDWKRPLGRPSNVWLRAVEADLGQVNIGLAPAWRKAAIRDHWRRIVDTHSNAPVEYAMEEENKMFKPYIYGRFLRV